MTMRRVRDVMTEGVFALLPEDDLVIAYRLMEGWRVRHVPVVEESGTPIGIVSQRDLLRTTLLGHPRVSREEMEEALRGTPVQDVMSVHVETIRPDAPLAVAAEKIYRDKIGCLVVIDPRGRLCGIVTEADFVRDAFPWRETPRDRSRALLLGALLGLVSGAVLGLLFAPDAGSKTRRELARRRETISRRAGNVLESASAWVDKGRERIEARTGAWGA